MSRSTKKGPFVDGHLLEKIVTLKLAGSKGEMRRLMQQGGFYVEQESVRDPAATWDGRPEVLIRLGKRRYFRIRR